MLPHRPRTRGPQFKSLVVPKWLGRGDLPVVPWSEQLGRAEPGPTISPTETTRRSRLIVSVRRAITGPSTRVRDALGEKAWRSWHPHIRIRTLYLTPATIHAPRKFSDSVPLMSRAAWPCCPCFTEEPLSPDRAESQLHIGPSNVSCLMGESAPAGSRI